MALTTSQETLKNYLEWLSFQTGETKAEIMKQGTDYRMFDFFKLSDKEAESCVIRLLDYTTNNSDIYIF